MTSSQTGQELIATLQQSITASLLPGDEPPSPERVHAAASFLATVAAGRGGDAFSLRAEAMPGEGGKSRATRVAMINTDMPFLVDSVAAAIASLGYAIDLLFHPVVPRGAGAPGESMIYVELGALDTTARTGLVEVLSGTLRDVHAAVADWRAMQAAMHTDADALARAGRHEGAALFNWFADGALTQLGHVRHGRDGSSGGALGIARTSPEPISRATVESAFAWFDASLADGAERVRWPLIVKSAQISQVHRRAPLDVFLVPELRDGRVVALSAHTGLWTSAALATPPGQVPRLRAQLAALGDGHMFAAGGHDSKALVHVLTKLPHDLIIALADADVERVALALMSLIDRPRPRLALVEEPLGRRLFAFVWLPRDAFSSALRRDIAAMLEHAADAKVIDWTVEVESNAIAELRFTLDMRDANAGLPDEASLETRLRVLLQGWSEALADELALAGAGPRAEALVARYADAFPASYRAMYGAGEAAMDLLQLVGLPAKPAQAGVPPRALRLYPAAAGAKGDEAAGRLRLKLYQREGALTLSEAVPALENFGFRVIDTVPTVVGSGARTLGHIHDFTLLAPTGAQLSPERLAACEAALAAVTNGLGEDDPFNRLIVAVGLAAAEANWLRAWYRYLRQAGLSYSIGTAVDALVSAPAVTRGLVALFRARHDPQEVDRAAAETAAEEAIAAGLAGVAAINDDRLLRAFRNVVLAMQRTNAFAPAAAEALACKFDSALVPGLPAPLPWREIFVYSARVEGIHLRAGPVARGGLRWSDRRDDFRTEVLGLMKAQRVKNAVIVPTGAKGGFYPKRLPDPARDRDGWAAEGRGAYQTFIRALLSITDNIAGGDVVHPAEVTVRDGEDPYFVVAADKGTATFSDTANALAEEAGFWLDDAFASGGSKGYDHKAMGITAKGGWISVQRHFREMGVDVQTDPVRVAGVGDMSGDVFGNGMLLSKSIQLVAAFDHRHIFLDPAPDAAKSHAERARLFALPRSSWADYNTALISPGGGVFPRGQKEIPLSAEVRAMLGVDDAVIDPEALIRAILTAPVDLLWFGGIGTYLRASHEGNAVGDPANDAIRVTAKQLRVKVIGEGANLGCTQAGRIEFALAGGRINTDFIDNSAGVDCSDKEVNIKIALASAKAAGRLDEDARVNLLVSMTQDVSALVLEDNRLQALALSVAAAGGAAAVAPALRLIEALEEAGQLDRATEGLADNDTLSRRAMDGAGLTRPELAVLLASAKLTVQAALEASAVPDDGGLDGELVAAFPPQMQQTFAGDIADHRLRREIIATRLANRLINRLGPVHPFELAEEEGVGLAEVTAAFLTAERLFGMAALWARIDAAAMPEPARIQLFARAAEAMRSHMADLLRAGAGQVPPLQLAHELAPGVGQIDAALTQLLKAEASALSARIRTGLAEADAPAELADAVARLFDLDASVGLAALARDTGAEVMALARAFVMLGGPLGLDWAQTTAVRMAPSDPWERLLIAGVARDLQQMRFEFLRRLDLTGRDPQQVVADWLAERETRVRQFRATTERARMQTAVTPAMLARIAGQARNLFGR